MGKFIKKKKKHSSKNLKDMSMNICELKSLPFLPFQQNQT